MQIDHIHFYVWDAAKWRRWFVEVMGFYCIAYGCNNHTYTEVVGSGKIKFVLSSPLSKYSPVAEYLSKHPEGVADVAFEVEEIEKVMEKARASGAKVEKAIAFQTNLKWCQIISCASLKHTLIERRGETFLLPYNWVQSCYQESYYSQTLEEIRFTEIDHLVLNVAAGELENTVSWYEKVLGFQRKQTFTIGTEKSALYSQVMIHPKSGVQFPVNEPMSVNSQIQEFIELNGGSGIQHLALKTNQITQVTQKLRSKGVEFLAVPKSYYTQMQKLNFSPQEWSEIMDQEILVDTEGNKSDNSPLLLQIFTQPIFNEPTFFFELIERRFQAKGFGEGNFRALFEAIEREQMKRGSLR